MGMQIRSLSFNLPFGIGGVTIEVDEAQQEAAWALYIELSTRVAGVGLEPGVGSAREALDSLYTLFDTTRSVLRTAGAGAARGPESVGPIAIEILNRGLRPFMAEWHTRLSAFEREEMRRPQSGGGASVIDESGWQDREAFYEALAALRKLMTAYVDALAQIAGIHH
jgi:hypothetical protein